MTTVTSAAELAGLILLVLAIALGLRRRPARRRPALRLIISRDQRPAAGAPAAGRPPQARKPALALVEDRVPGTAALQLEEAVGAGDQEHSVPEPGSVLAARDR